jgi:tRNA (cmo5U34)-methyltransferase
MTRQSIAAYDVSKRVAFYDRDMELMHPNRSKMVQVALEVLPFAKASRIRALDLGVGTGFFTEHLLRHFPNSEVLAIDGAQAMIDLAKARLGSLTDRVEFVVGDFRDLRQLVGNAGGIAAVFSAFALHHLNKPDKEAVVRQAVDLLRPGGWFVNADIIVADSPEVEKRIQQLRVAGIVERAGGLDERFANSTLTRQFLDNLEKTEGDQPLTLLEDLALLRNSGLKNVAAFWCEYRELVSGGQKEQGVGSSRVQGARSAEQGAKSKEQS